ncbi:hypothetical protein M0R19_03620 [Candidatus Pacearchaeota archaeon]|jgi:hypothetical protein|nr:hypothetical protein [Candidatus Pacearchaeota archaeon]
MSHSFKKSPICGFTSCSSEKGDKKIANKKHRKINKCLILKIIKESDEENSEIIFKDMKELTDVFFFNKDGKSFFDEKKHPSLMRK